MDIGGGGICDVGRAEPQNPTFFLPEEQCLSHSAESLGSASAQATGSLKVQ